MENRSFVLRDTELYGKLIREFIPSPEMSAFLLKNPVGIYDAVDIVLKAAEPLEKKTAMLQELAEAAGTQFGDGAGADRSVRQMILEYAGGIGKAMKELSLRPGEVFSASEHWFDPDILEEKASDEALFRDLQAFREYERKCRLAEAEDGSGDEDYYGWYVLKKWVPGDAGAMENPYTYICIRSEPVYFTRNVLRDGYWWYPKDRTFAGGYPDLDLPVPFRPGDIVLLDCGTFAPAKPALLLTVGDGCCGIWMLYRGVDGKWHTGALKHRNGWSDSRGGYTPIVSPLYRLRTCRDATEDPAGVLQAIGERIRRDAEFARSLSLNDHELEREIRKITEEQGRAGESMNEEVILNEKLNIPGDPAAFAKKFFNDHQWLMKELADWPDGDGPVTEDAAGDSCSETIETERGKEPPESVPEEVDKYVAMGYTPEQSDEIKQLLKIFPNAKIPPIDKSTGLQILTKEEADAWDY